MREDLARKEGWFWGELAQKTQSARKGKRKKGVSGMVSLLSYFSSFRVLCARKI